MEEPGDERMAQIMREVAEDARESTRRAAERVAAGIDAASHEARARVEETLNRLRNGSKWAQTGADCDCRAQRVGQDFHDFKDSASWVVGGFGIYWYRIILMAINIWI